MATNDFAVTTNNFTATTNDFAMTMGRWGGRPHPHRGELRETWDGQSILYGAGRIHRWRWDGDPRYDRSGEWAGPPGQEATPTQQNVPFHWLVLAGVLLLLSAVLGVCQSEATGTWNPFRTSGPPF